MRHHFENVDCKAESTFVGKSLSEDKEMDRKELSLECNNQIRLDSPRSSKQFVLSHASLQKEILVVLAKPTQNNSIAKKVLRLLKRNP